jgi:two-component system sensor histidine kinase DegS
MAIDPASASPSTLDDVTERARTEVAQLDRELGEIEMLVNQARAEAARHEQKRSQAADKLAVSKHDPREAVEQSSALVTLTRRAAVMEAQVDVLEGKRKSLARFRDALAGYAGELSAVGPSGSADGAGAAELTPAMSRVVLRAQEDLRREIARSMHDGPAQSLTNIVLQAQIVERLVMRDQHAASIELRQLIAMVQQTLEATKTFIFDVRPMVLDDLGLVPTMRRAARDRGQRAKVAVDFDSLGSDRRLPMDIESTVFRILDEALAAYLAAGPERLTVRLDWTADKLEATIAAERDVVLPTEPDLTAPTPTKGKDKGGRSELPPALAEMVAQRKADHEAAIVAAHTAAIVALPANVRREIHNRAATIDAQAEIPDDGSSLRLLVPLPPPEAAETGQTAS